MMKIIFFGSDDFAAAHFNELIASKHDIVACVTQPDRPKGRGMKVVALPVKECAEMHKITILQPTSVKDKKFINELKGLDCELFVVIAYGQILPIELLKMPPKGAINVHSSLLPKYRGAAPINWAIMQGEKETGVSIINMAAECDAGDVIEEEKIKIDDHDTAVTLKAKLAKIGPPLLFKAIDLIEKGRIQPVAQKEELISFAPKLTKELGHIQWTKGAQEIHNMVRGLLPWPTAYTLYKGKMLKVLEVEIKEIDPSDRKPGQVVNVDKNGFVVATGQDALLVKKVHLEASKQMTADEFVRGHKLEKGFEFE